MKNTFLFAFLMTALCTLMAMGQMPGNPPRYCRNGFFPHDSASFRIAHVNKNAPNRNYFYDDAAEDCPRSPKCKTRSYLVAGDEVIVSRVLDGFACVWFDAKGDSETVGWIDAEKLNYEPAKSTATNAEWIGNWSFYDSEIRVKPVDGSNLYFVGEAFWRGSSTNIHSGEIDYPVRMNGAEITFGEDPEDEYGCRVTSRLVGRFMIVADNMNCGGVNVTFSGVYRRVATKLKKN